MTDKIKPIFETLAAIDVSQFIEKKPTGKKKLNPKTNKWEESYLSYLSWMHAWKELKRHYPSSTYQVKLFDGKAWMHDSNLGYMIFTNVTVEDDTKECWLPVMDSRNNAMKDKRYSYSVNEYKDKQVIGQKEVWVEAATMFDINTTIMRCIAKNIAMHGLGAYIYAGEDLPFLWDEEVTPEPKTKAKPITVTPEPLNNVNREEIITQVKEIIKEKATIAHEIDSVRYGKIMHNMSNIEQTSVEQLLAMKQWLEGLK